MGKAVLNECNYPTTELVHGDACVFFSFEYATAFFVTITG